MANTNTLSQSLIISIKDKRLLFFVSHQIANRLFPILFHNFVSLQHPELISFHQWHLLIMSKDNGVRFCTPNEIWIRHNKSEMVLIKISLAITIPAK